MTDTLKENYEFRRAYTRGKCFAAPVLVTYVFRRKGCPTRIGITTGKKLGNAVMRNRARRVIRAAWRNISDGVLPGADIVFVARTRTSACKSTEVERVMLAQLKAADMLRRSEAVELETSGN